MLHLFDPDLFDPTPLEKLPTQQQRLEEHARRLDERIRQLEERDRLRACPPRRPELDQILALAADTPYRDISQQVGLPYSRVYAICRQAGVKAPRAPTALTDTERNRQIIEQVLAGISYTIIAHAHRITRQRVQQICRRAGVRSQLPPAAARRRKSVGSRLHCRLPVGLGGRPPFHGLHAGYPALTQDQAIAVIARLGTAVMALESAAAEAAQPVASRDVELLEMLLDALRLARLAQQRCEAALRDWPLLTTRAEK
jgi:hypothetical protein